MGKSLVIKNADFSANGFTYTEQSVTYGLSSLMDKTGAAIEDVTTIAIANGNWWYEQQTSAGSGVFRLMSATNLNGLASTSYATSQGGDDPTPVSAIEVGDYEFAEVTTKLDISTQGSGIVTGLAIMFFLDADKLLIGGLSTGNNTISGTKCEQVGAVANVTTFKRAIPSGCKYILCSTQTNDFSLKLSKYTKA